MYRYLNIRGESDYSKFLPVEDIFSCIANIPELSQLSDRSFESVAGAPWFLVSIISCSSTGCYPGRTSHTNQNNNHIQFQALYLALPRSSLAISSIGEITHSRVKCGGCSIAKIFLIL